MNPPQTTDLHKTAVTLYRQILQKSIICFDCPDFIEAQRVVSAIAGELNAEIQADAETLNLLIRLQDEIRRSKLALDHAQTIAFRLSMRGNAAGSNPTH